MWRRPQLDLRRPRRPPPVTGRRQSSIEGKCTTDVVNRHRKTCVVCKPTVTKRKNIFRGSLTHHHIADPERQVPINNIYNCGATDLHHARSLLTSGAFSVTCILNCNCSRSVFLQWQIHSKQPHLRLFFSLKEYHVN